MKKTLAGLTVIALLLTVLSSCKKDDTSTSGNFTVKYEIITSSPIASSELSSGILVYTNGTGQVEAVQNVLQSGTSWSKTVTVTTSTRPLQLSLSPASARLSAPGSITSNIYINGVIKATSTGQSTTIGDVNLGVVPMLLYIVE